MAIAIVLAVAVFPLFIVLFSRYKFTPCQKDLLGARWLRILEMSLVVVVITLARCFCVPLSIFLISRWTLQNDEQYCIKGILICHGEPELYRNICLPKKTLSLKGNDKLK